MFRFATPEYLYLLALIPVLAVIYVLAARNRRKRLERFGKASTMTGLMPDASPKRARNKFIVYLLAVTLVILALARPQTGSKLKEVTREGVEIMLAIDISNSMLAQDLSPNRLERTKYDVARMLEGFNEDRVGVVVFAGDAYVQLPITTDYVTARNFVDQISTGIISKQGTAIGAAISLAASSFSSGSENSRAIILITDGENHEDNALAAAEHAAAQGIRIYTIGIGTPEGAPIQVGDDFIRDDKGEIVVSKLDEETLRQIALVTDGAYIRSGNQSIGLKEIIDAINETQKSELTAIMFEEFDEQYQYLLGVALLLLLIEAFILPRKNPLLSKYNIFNKQ